MESRSSKRLPFIRKTKFGESNPIYFGYTINISEGGVGFKTYTPLDPGSQIITEIFLGEEILRLTGVVKWESFSPYETISVMGIKITSHPEKIKDIYSKLASMNIH